MKTTIENQKLTKADRLSRLAKAFVPRDDDIYKKIRDINFVCWMNLSNASGGFAHFKDKFDMLNFLIDVSTGGWRVLGDTFAWKKDRDGLQQFENIIVNEILDGQELDSVFDDGVDVTMKELISSLNPESYTLSDCEMAAFEKYIENTYHIEGSRIFRSFSDAVDTIFKEYMEEVEDDGYMDAHWYQFVSFYCDDVEDSDSTLLDVVSDQKYHYLLRASIEDNIINEFWIT